MSSMSISVAIPAYKGAYLAEAISSALEQDYPITELIVVNDHSPEDIKGIVDSFNDPRIHYYENLKNFGRLSIVLNWNRCLSLAKGDFFVLLCDDDLLDTGFVSALKKLADSYPDCNVFHARTRIFDSSTNSLKGETPIWPEWESFEDFACKALSGEKHHTITEFMFRTKSIRDKGGYIVFPAGYYSDTASILNFADKGGICSFKEPLATYRKNKDCISSRSDFNVEKSQAALEFFHWILKKYPQFISYSTLIDLLDFDLASYYSSATLTDSLRILGIVPSNIWSLKQKAALMIKKLNWRYEE